LPTRVRASVSNPRLASSSALRLSCIQSQPPQRSKCGHSGCDRCFAGSVSSQASASTNCRWFLDWRTLMLSPGTTPPANPMRPSDKWASPRPPGTSRSIFQSGSVGSALAGMLNWFIHSCRLAMIRALRVALVRSSRVSGDAGWWARICDIVELGTGSGRSPLKTDFTGSVRILSEIV